MKTKTITILLLGIIAALCMATECQKEPPLDELPPETRTGANTFGCYVNGELFVKRPASLYLQNPLSVGYIKETKQLRINCDAAGEHFFNMYIYIDSPQENSVLSVGYLTPEFNTSVCEGFGCENCGRVFITKFDTINRIASGTFQFLGRCARRFSGLPMNYEGDSIVHITDGRFDVKF